MASRLQRKNIRLEAQDYVGERQYFVTMCCARRRPLFTGAGVAKWAADRLSQAAARYAFSIHAYCFMPDHLHFLAEGVAADSSLWRFVADYKQTTGFEFQRRRAQQLWQFKYYDHILRRTDGLESVAWYIWLNPVRKGCCREPREYPHCGSLTEFGNKAFSRSWHENWSPPWRKTSFTV